jgi:hypothetical protein
MAEVPYNGGVATVAPREAPPDDYQHINATPEAFGAAIGRGVEKVGGGLPAGRQCPVAIDSACQRRRNETRSLSLMSALRVKSGTSSLTCEATTRIIRNLQSILAVLGDSYEGSGDEKGANLLGRSPAVRVSSPNSLGRTAVRTGVRAPTGRF